MRNRNLFMMLPIVLVFGFSVLFLFIVMMNARNVEASRIKIHEIMSGTTDESMEEAKGAVSMYIKDVCVDISEGVRISVDREVLESDKTISDEIIREKYITLYEEQITKALDTNVKSVMRDLNSIMPVLERGSIYINTKEIPKLEIEYDEETGLMDDIRLCNIYLDYMYRGEVIRSAEVTVDIDNPFWD